MADYLQVSASVQILLRVGLAFCTLGAIGLTLPQANRFLGTAKRGGYIEDSPWLTPLFSPVGRAVILSSWTAAACWLLLGSHTIPAACLSLVWSRTLFIHLRWRSLSRGMGAPGFMLYWLSALVFCLEWTANYDANGWLRALVVLTFKVDFAVIMICAGQYKLFSGYPQNNGMERGLVNPWWGRLWCFYSSRSPHSLLFRFYNHMAYLGEIIAGILMLYPPTSEWGAIFMALSFVFILLHIKLGWLCPTVITCCFLFSFPGGVLDSLLPTGPVLHSLNTPPYIIAVLNGALSLALLSYLILLLPTKLALYINFYCKIRLSPRLQTFFDAWANLWGIIIWRVFTIDNTNFYVNIFSEDQYGNRQLLTHPGRARHLLDLRYLHVCEFVTLTCVFTSLKYYPHTPEIFAQRLTTYAQSVPCPANQRLIFQWVDIQKKNNGFHYVASREFHVDEATRTISVTDLLDGSSATDLLRFSTLVSGYQVGSYAPASRK